MTTRKGPLPGSTGRNKTDIARIANHAHTHGQRMSEAIALHYHISPKAARSTISNTRRAGYYIPHDSSRNPAIRRAYNAATLRQLVELVHSLAQQPAPPRPAPKPRPPAPPGLVLACADCNHTTPIDGHQPAATLARHTHTDHHRPPSRHERTPQPAQAAA